MADAGATQYTFHLEATEGPEKLITQIKEAGMKVRTNIFHSLLRFDKILLGCLLIHFSEMLKKQALINNSYVILEVH